jgi:hypothetical protein
MLPLVADENLNRRIVRGLRLVVADLDCVIAQEEGLTGKDDPEVLAWAAAHGRALVTHDVSTIPRFAYDRIAAGDAMAGVIVVPKALAIGMAIEELAVVVECSDRADLEGQVLFLPL